MRPIPSDAIFVVAADQGHKVSSSLSDLTLLFGSQTMIHRRRIRFVGFATVSCAFLACFALGGLTPEARAAVLWDQSATTTDDVVDQVFPDFGDFSTWVVGDVSFATSVTITDIYTFGTFFFGASPGATVDASLTLFPKTGPSPTAGDAPGNLGTFSANYDDTTGELHLSGILLPLAAGDYWVGLTPVASFGTNGQRFHQESTTTIGDLSAARNPGGGFGSGTDWAPTSAFGAAVDDMSLRIDGIVGTAVVPEPSSLLIFAGLMIPGVAFVRYRRAREKARRS